MNFKRLIIDLILLFLAIASPWWLALPLSFFATFLFEDYFEIIFFGFCIDALTASPIPFFHGFQFIFTALSVFLYLLSAYIRKKIVLYD